MLIHEVDRIMINWASSLLNIERFKEDFKEYCKKEHNATEDDFENEHWIEKIDTLSYETIEHFLSTLDESKGIFTVSLDYDDDMFAILEYKHFNN